MEVPLSYQEIQDAYTVNRWETGQHYCMKVIIPDGSVLLKVSTVCTPCIIHCIMHKSQACRHQSLPRMISHALLRNPDTLLIVKFKSIFPKISQKGT